MKNSVIKLHKLIILQIYGYLALIPLVFAFISLLENYNIKDLIIYSIGAIFILVLLIINHLEPVARITVDKILLYNTFNNRPLVLLKSNYNSYEKINNRLIKFTFNKTDYELKLNKNELIKFIQILEEIN